MLLVTDLTAPLEPPSHEILKISGLTRCRWRQGMARANLLVGGSLLVMQELGPHERAAAAHPLLDGHSTRNTSAFGPGVQVLKCNNRSRRGSRTPVPTRYKTRATRAATQPSVDLDQSMLNAWNQPTLQKDFIPEAYSFAAFKRRRVELKRRYSSPHSNSEESGGKEDSGLIA